MKRRRHAVRPTDVDKLVLQIKRDIERRLHGRPPELQGGALADLVAMFFAGHHPSIRQESMEIWLEAMHSLIAPNERMLFERLGGRPEGWHTYGEKQG
jgi:hypothetical protein